ncbi:unnamed protein product [Phytomonas sp. EM1]|nr:unnamed protein product [Phytomonas sp. EM1]|eukprot:CCW65856.1 unnamed protein product [Phytomonas sp. isolate EM1]
MIVLFHILVLFIFSPVFSFATSQIGEIEKQQAIVHLKFVYLSLFFYPFIISISIASHQYFNLKLKISSYPSSFFFFLLYIYIYIYIYTPLTCFCARINHYKLYTALLRVRVSLS